MEVAGESKEYRYPNYSFTNTSRDILDLLQDALLRLDLRPSRYERIIAIRRRQDVAALDKFIGPKT
jgi:hypothetical protein